MTQKIIKMKHTILYTLAIAISALFLTACEEVIDIDLNSSNPRIVVEATIEPDSVCEVLLTYSANYFNNQKPTVIDNAVVTITDNLGSNESLLNIGNGRYKGSNIKGFINRSYTLDVVTNNHQISGTAKIPSKGLIIDVVAKESEPLFGNSNDFKEYYLEVILKDDPIQSNYYLLEFSSNNFQFDQRMQYVDDKNFGENNLATIKQWRNGYYVGDQATVTVYSVDKNVYLFHKQLQEIISGGGMGGPTSTPYNPQSNMTPDALGCFMARSIDKVTIDIK